MFLSLPVIIMIKLVSNIKQIGFKYFKFGPYIFINPMIATTEIGQHFDKYIAPNTIFLAPQVTII